MTDWVPSYVLKGKAEPGRVWFYKPSWYWSGWKSLLPIWRGHDEYARWTIVFGWDFTGRMIIAVKRCKSRDCEIDRARQMMEDQQYEND